jgi:hypothetical protein
VRHWRTATTLGLIAIACVFGVWSQAEHWRPATYLAWASGAVWPLAGGRRSPLAAEGDAFGRQPVVWPSAGECPPSRYSAAGYGWMLRHAHGSRRRPGGAFLLSPPASDEEGVFAGRLPPDRGGYLAAGQSPSLCRVATARILDRGEQP